MRILIIVGICIVFGSVGLFFYLEQDTRKFAETLPKAPSARVTKETSDPVPQSNGIETTHTTRGETDIDTGDIRVANTDTENAVPPQQAERISEAGTSDPEDEAAATDIVDEYSLAEKQAIFEQAFAFPVKDIDETYTQLSEILTAHFGADPDISNFLSTWKALNTVMTLADTAEYQGGREEDVNAFLNQLPAIVIEDMVEISIRLFNPSESEAENLRAQVAGLRMEIDSIAIATEAKPFIEEAIRLGDLTPEEGAAFISEVSGLDVQVVPK